MSWGMVKAKCHNEEGKGGFLESLLEPEVPRMDLTKVQVAVESSKSKWKKYTEQPDESWGIRTFYDTQVMKQDK